MGIFKSSCGIHIDLSAIYAIDKVNAGYVPGWGDYAIYFNIWIKLTDRPLKIVSGLDIEKNRKEAENWHDELLNAWTEYKS